MAESKEARNKALVLKAFETLFNKRDYTAAERFWSPNYIQHSSHIEPGREGLLNLIKSLPPTLNEGHFDKLFNINVRGTLFTVQKALPLLSDGGSIILNGSVASVKGTAAFGVYAASKAAIRFFVRTWTTDLKDRHIRSNVVSPGPINTPLAGRQSAEVIAKACSQGHSGQPVRCMRILQRQYLQRFTLSC